MRKVILFVLAIVLGSALILGSCGEEAPAPAPAPAPAQAPAPAPPTPEKIEFIYADHAPPMAGGNVFFREYFVPRLIEMSGPYGDKLEFTYYHASSLFPYADQVNGCEQGLCDITTWVSSYEAERAPLNDVINLPFMGFQSTGIATQVFEALYWTVPEVAAEYKGFEVMGRWAGLKRNIGGRGEIAITPADYKGRKVHASSVVAEIFESLGAAPIQQPPSDWYTSLDRGVFDSIASGLSMYLLFNLSEVLDYAIDCETGSFGYTATNWVMNKEKFESLPLEVQGAIRALRPFFLHSVVLMDANETAAGVQDFLDKGGTIYMLTPEEEQEWFDVCKPFHEKWIADMEARGAPAQMVYDECQKWIALYRQGVPPGGLGAGQ